MFLFKRIVLSIRPQVEAELIEQVTRALSPHCTLFRDPGTQVQLAPHLPLAPEPFDTTTVDLIVVIGGDGSVLHIAARAAQAGLPVVGIHRGRLGFLTDIPHTDAVKALIEVLQGHYEEEQRSLIQTQFCSEQPSPKPHALAHWALNDLVINASSTGRMMDLQVQINGAFVWQQRADGVILATPTGSTAYALSAGGPVIHPGLHALLLIPMYPHSLSCRPLIIPDDAEITIIGQTADGLSPLWSTDGVSMGPLPSRTCLRVTKAPLSLRLLHPRHYDYFDVLRRKLNWGGMLGDDPAALACPVG